MYEEIIKVIEQRDLNAQELFARRVKEESLTGKEEDILLTLLSLFDPLIERFVTTCRNTGLSIPQTVKLIILAFELENTRGQTILTNELVNTIVGYWKEGHEDRRQENQSRE